MAESVYKPDFPSEIIREGKVQVLVPKLEAYSVNPSDYAPSKAPVFYNPSNGVQPRPLGSGIPSVPTHG